MERFKYYIYTRCSTEEQSKGYSHDMQINGIKSHPKCNLGTCVRTFSDSSTGRSFNRVELNKMLLSLRKNHLKVHKIIIWSWDRFGRNLEEALRTVREIHDLGVQIESLDNHIDFDAPEWILQFSIYGALAELESAKISERTKAGMNEAMREGNYCPSLPPGYRRILKSNRRHEIVQNNQAPIIKELFEKALYGISKQELYKIYGKKLGIKRSAFFDIFDRKFYTGYYDVKAYKNMPAVTVRGNYEPIISVEVFEKLRSESRSYKPRVVLNSFFYLKGFLKCGLHYCDCSGYFSAGRNGKKYEYYQAIKKKGNIMNAKKVHQSIEALLMKLRFEYDDEMIGFMQEAFDEEITKRRISIKNQYNQLEKIEKKIENITDQFISEKIDTSTMNRITSRLAEKKERMKLDILQLENEFEEKDYNLKEVFETFNQLGNIFIKSNNGGKLDILRMIFPEGILMSKENYRVRTTFINEAILQMSTNTSFLENIEKEKGVENPFYPPMGERPDIKRNFIRDLNLVFDTLHKIKSLKSA